MKVLLVTQYFWPENFIVNHLSEMLSSKGHDITVLTGKPNYPVGSFFSGYTMFGRSRECLHSINIVRVPIIPRGSGSSVWLAVNYLSFVLSACVLGPFRCRGEFDLIFVFEPSPFTVGIPAMFFRWLKGAPMMFWVQDLWPESLMATGAVRNPYLLRLVGRMVRMIYHRCDRVLIQSEAFMEPAVKAGADPERIRYFPNWAESLYQPVVLPDNAVERKEIPDGFCVMFAGNLGEAQSLETILQAAIKVKSYGENVVWVLIGDGRRMAWMRSEVKRLELDEQVCFLGRRPVDAMPRYFALADALLVTLRSDPIFSCTIPSKIQSYLACARPVVAALDGEGARIIRDSGAGFAVAAGDAEALAEKVLQLKAMPESERVHMGNCGRAYFEKHFESEMLVSRLERWMNALVREGRCVS